MNVAVCCDRRFVSVVVNQGEVPFLELLILVAQIHAHRVGEPAGAVIGGADAEPDNNLVGVQVVDLRVPG